MRSPFIRNWVPTRLREIANKALGATIVYKGPYPDWEGAQRATTGYDADFILRRVHNATQRVFAGDADYEQDGSAMSGIPAPGHALPALLLAAALDGGRLSVLDFGGGLGSHFLRWRSSLAPLPDLHWTIVEQAHFAVVGRRLFADLPVVTFVEDVPAAADARPNAVLLSSVLQYLPDPFDAFDRLIALAPRVLVIDRTPLLDAGSALILSQHVPRQLGRASYPIRVLSRSAIEDRLQPRYMALSQFESSDTPIRVGAAVARFGGSAWIRRA